MEDRLESVRCVCRMSRKNIGELVHDDCECVRPWHRERMHRFNALICDAEDQLLLLSLELKKAEEAECDMGK